VDGANTDLSRDRKRPARAWPLKQELLIVEKLNGRAVSVAPESFLFDSFASQRRRSVSNRGLR